MIKRMKENLKSKKGFTLVELIVVIVIILILAAVMIPNVMRYIGQARESTFQSDASAYLTEIQGFAAEYYAKNSKDITAAGAPGFTDEYALTNNAKVSFKTPYAEAKGPFSGTDEKDREITVTIDKGAVTEFSYANTEHHINWTQETGWTNVDEPTTAAAPGE